jgi:hypothetical protein
MLHVFIIRPTAASLRIQSSGHADVSSEQILSLQRFVVPLKVRNQCHIKEDLNLQKQFCENLKPNTLLVSYISCYFFKVQYTVTCQLSATVSSPQYVAVHQRKIKILYTIELLFRLTQALSKGGAILGLYCIYIQVVFVLN